MEENKASHTSTRNKYSSINENAHYNIPKFMLFYEIL